MKFLKTMTFAQGMIIICLVGSIALAPRLFSNHNKIKSLTAAVAEGGELSSLVARIQSNSQLYSQLHEQKSGESLQGQGRATEYILRVAGGDSVDLGRINLPKPSRASAGSGAFDETFTIKPADPNRAFDRTRIGNFLFSLEDGTRRLRVTQLILTALNEAGKTRVKHEEFPSDNWAFSCKVTSRSRPPTE